MKSGGSAKKKFFFLNGLHCKCNLKHAQVTGRRGGVNNSTVGGKRGRGAEEELLENWRVVGGVSQRLSKLRVKKPCIVTTSVLS